MRKPKPTWGGRRPVAASPPRPSSRLYQHHLPDVGVSHGLLLCPSLTLTEQRWTTLPKLPPHSRFVSKINDFCCFKTQVLGRYVSTGLKSRQPGSRSHALKHLQNALTALLKTMQGLCVMLRVNYDLLGPAWSVCPTSPRTIFP